MIDLSPLNFLLDSCSEFYVDNSPILKTKGYQFQDTLMNLITQVEKATEQGKN